MGKTHLNIDEVKKRINEKGYSIISCERLNNSTGYIIRLQPEGTINLYDTGSVVVNGKGDTNKIESFIIETPESNQTKYKNKIFIVYGHDKTVKSDTEMMLRRWGLEPIFLDRVTSGSNTIIEQLEKYIREDKVDYAIVLMTPDDEGFKKGLVNEKKISASTKCDS